MKSRVLIACCFIFAQLIACVVEAGVSIEPGPGKLHRVSINMIYGDNVSEEMTVKDAYRNILKQIAVYAKAHNFTHFVIYHTTRSAIADKRLTIPKLTLSSYGLEGQNVVVLLPGAMDKALAVEQFLEPSIAQRGTNASESRQ